MTDFCEKHGPYATFCRECDYDLVGLHPGPEGARLLITGGRGYPFPDFVFATLSDFHASTPIAVLIHGNCPTGVDNQSDQWAARHGIARDPYPAKWNDIDAPGAKIRFNRRGAYNVLAGFQRNAEMVRASCPTHAIAFPGSRGTDDCVAHIMRAIRAGQQIEFRDLRRSGPGTEPHPGAWLPGGAAARSGFTRYGSTS